MMTVTFLLVIVYALLLLIAGSFSALETALLVLREKNVRAMEDDLPANPKSRQLLRDSSATLEDAMFLGSMSNLMVTAAALYLILSPFKTMGLKPWLSSLIIVGVSLLVVEILPRACALRSPTTIARVTLPLLRLCRRLVLPAARPLQNISRQLAGNLSSKKVNPRKLMSDEELITFIEMKEEQGSVDKLDAGLLHHVTVLNQMAARDLMLPRVDIPLMPHDAEEEEANSMLESTRHPFVAVYDKKEDGVTSLIQVREWKLMGRPYWKNVVSEPAFTHESLPILKIWEDHLKDDRFSSVIVVDEYGGFQGLLTHQDVVNHVLSKTAPASEHQASIQPMGSNRYLIAGNTRLAEVEHELDINFDNDSVDTIGGLVINLFGGTPKPGQRIMLQGFEIKIKKTAKLRVQQLEIRLMEDFEI